MSQGIILPPPYRGLNRRDPLAAMSPEYAQWVEGFRSSGGYLSVREGFIVHCVYSSGDPSDDICLGNGVYKDLLNGDEIYAILYKDATNDSRIVNMTTSSASSAHTGGSEVPDIYIFRNFNGYLFVVTYDVSIASACFKYDGTNWTDLSFTVSGSPLYSIPDIYYFKSRPYIFSNNGTSAIIYYGDVGAVGGALTQLDFISIFRDSQGTAYITSVTISDVISSEEFFVVGGAEGEVLVYSGDYPEASNWTIRGQFQTGKPLGKTPIVKVNGDSYIITENGIVSLRSLFQYGNQAASIDFSLSAQINPYLIRLVKAARLNSSAFDYQYQWASGIYWPERNSVIFNIWGAIDKDGAWMGGTSGIPDYSTIIEYNLSTESWTINFINAVLCQLFIANNKLYGGAYYINGDFPQKVVMIELFQDGVYKDEVLTNIGTYQGINYDLVFAPNDISTRQAIKKITGVEFLLNTDSYTSSASTFGVKTIVDFGRQESSNSYQPVQPDGYIRAYFGVGAEGTFFQQEISGTTNKDETIGLELYSSNVYYEVGGQR